MDSLQSNYDDELNADLDVNIVDADSSFNEGNTKAANVSIQKEATPTSKKLVRLPLARVRHIMKLDPECGKISQDTVFVVTKATELFLEFLGRESAKYTQQSKRKTVQRRDVDAVIENTSQLCFLEGALE